MRIAFFIILILVFWATAFLDNVLRSTSAKELKRRARGSDQTAARLYKLSAYSQSTSPLLWLIGGFSLGGLILMFNKWVWWQVLLMALALALLYWGSKTPKIYPDGLLKIASYIGVPISWLMAYLSPVFSKLASQKNHKHTGAYEKEDLLELIKLQHHQIDNRISDNDLKLALNALQFGDKTVGQIMRPKKKVKWVSEDDDIGPLLMDELHASGLDSFPVVKDSTKKSNSPEVIGTLFMSDLVDQAEGGRVSSVMRKQTYFINEDDSLSEALNAFGKTHHHLLVVINDFEEVVGVLTFGLLARQIFNEKPIGDFEQYHDKRAVASRKTEKAEPTQEKT